MSTKITINHISFVVAACARQSKKLQQHVKDDPLLAIDIHSEAGRKDMFNQFWPKGNEESLDLMENSLRNWINFYTALYLSYLTALSKLNTKKR